MAMNSIKFKKGISKQNQISNETLKNSFQDVNKIFKKLQKLGQSINECETIEELNKIENLANISNDLGFLTSNTIIIKDLNFRRRIEETNQILRETEIAYFDKKIELLNGKLNENYKKTNVELKEITGNTLFSIAAIFLGISLTSALVSGIEFITSDLIILYFMTCLLIAIIVIGLAAIFIRKFDIKSVVITIIILIVSVIWFLTFKNYESIIKNNKDNDNKIVESKSN